MTSRFAPLIKSKPICSLLFFLMISFFHRWLRRHIGYIPQEPTLFNDSIADNIRYGNPSASMDDIIQAAKQANAHDFISELSQGYHTKVGERGVALSGGKWNEIVSFFMH
jgi:ABC-type multidrug transport system fused ATPase/permease subunit